MFGKVFESMYDGSLRARSPWQALVTFQQMIVLCNKHGELDMTAEALSARTGIPLDVIETGIAALLLPDPESRTPAEEGRRIVPIDPARSWGWRIVNHGLYRKIRSEEERREYMRLLMRERRSKGETVSNVSSPLAGVSNVSPCSSASASAVDLEQEKPKQQKATAVPAVTRLPIPGTPDPLDATLAEAGLVLADFGQYASNVAGLIRAARSPLAVAQTIAALLPAHGGIDTPAVVGLAAREYAAEGKEFNARYFAAFVNRAAKVAGQQSGRKANMQAATFDATEDRDRERGEQEEAEAALMLTDFANLYPERFSELLGHAEQQVPATVKSATIRGPMVKAILLTLVRHDSARGEETGGE